MNSWQWQPDASRSAAVASVLGHYPKGAVRGKYRLVLISGRGQAPFSRVQNVLVLEVDGELWVMPAADRWFTNCGNDRGGLSPMCTYGFHAGTTGGCPLQCIGSPERNGEHFGSGREQATKAK